ncbi:MAG: alpha-1,2-fucosyltransferase [Lachnospiraceae bacterium]|nr:alpha-1,2-fucosyltransferase [Lachnospiraceae bacterium]
MIVIRFGGGLGNQLFQYAKYWMIKKKFPDELICYDASVYNIFNEHEGFKISKYFEFNVESIDYEWIKYAKPLEYYLIKNKIIIKNLKQYKIYYKIEKILGNIFQKKKLFYISDDDYGEHFNSDNDYYYDGRWQDITGYDINYLRNCIKFKIKLSLYEEKIAKGMLDTISISIHVRRGDFIDNKGYNLCSLQYYRDAIRMLIESEKLDKDNIKLYFFSDDKDYIKNSFKYNNMVVVEGESAGSEMKLMTYTKYNIIANSTFSFWGALLSKRCKQVIAPKYFTYSRGKFESFSIPLTWKTIDNS